MIKTISSRLTAHYQPDGGHLQRYNERRATITKSLCEDLILHDQVLVPTMDYLTAVGLLQILGEQGLVELLEQQRIKFIRTRRVFGFVRGKDRDGGLIVLSDPADKRPQDSPIEDSVAAGLTVFEGKIADRRKLHRLLVENSIHEETTDILAKVGVETIQDFKISIFWKPDYDFPKPGLVSLPGVAKMQVKVMGTLPNPKTAAVDTLLALARYNTDVFLARRYECSALSSFAPIGDLLDIKATRAGFTQSDVWELFEITGVPDLSQADFHSPNAFSSFQKLISSKAAGDFRTWFHSIKSPDRNTVLKEYVAILNQVPWMSRLPGKAFRFVTTTGLGLVPVAGPILGAAAGLVDSFVIDQLFRPPSPKFFVDELNKVAGVLRKPS